MCSLVMLQISHLVGMDAGKAVREIAGQREGGERQVQQELVHVSSLGQGGLCCLSDKQIPSFLMGQVGLSVPELAESVTGSNRHRLFYGARATQRSLLSCEVSLSCALPLFLWNKLLWMVS